MGGKIPLNNSHFVIDRPDSVNLVNPPTIIISPTSIIKEINQTETKLYFVIDFLNGGELFTYLRKEGRFAE